MSGLTVDDPVSLHVALASDRVIPGDVLELRGGTYKNDWVCNIGGTSGNPVIIKPYNGETVIIDGSFTCNRPYIELYDMELMDSDTNRIGKKEPIRAEVAGFGMYGCIVHDYHNSGLLWFGSGAGEVCENMFFNNGYRDVAGGAGLGHGVYTHNNGGGARLLARNLFFDQLGKYCFQIFSGGDNYLKDYTVEDNVICGDNVHAGGGLGLVNFLFQNNIFYGSVNDYIQIGRYSTEPGQDATIRNNYFIDVGGYRVDNIETLTESGNIAWSNTTNWLHQTGFTSEGNPEIWTKVIPFSKSRRWVAGVEIYNRDAAESVSVDLSGIDAGNYIMRNAQNPAETWAFSWDGITPVDVPTNWTSAGRIGDTLHGTTWPVFGGLVVEIA